MAKRFIVSPEDFGAIETEILRIKRQLIKKGGSLFDPQDVLTGLQSIAKKKKNLILQLLSGNETLFIEACDGTKTLASNKKLLLLNNNFDGDNSCSNEKNNGREETLIDVYETIKAVTLSKTFSSLADDDWDTICPTEHQVSIFCEKYPHYLCRGNDNLTTFFLLKCEGNPYIVARIFLREGRLVVLKDRFVGSAKARIWPPGVRLVVPRLDT